MKAFPHERDEGMDLRDWFAGMALPELINISERATAGSNEAGYKTTLRVIATQAYDVADAMMEARNVQRKP